MNAKILAPLVLVILLLSAQAATFSQTGGAPLPPADSPLGQLEPLTSSAPSTPAMEAERAKIWNSPAMLRARAWAQDYCSHSAKITPQEAKDYMVELQRMTPKQMKLWLLKFNEQEEMMQQQQAAFEQSRQDSLQQAMAIHQSTQRAYGRINQDENEAAAVAEQSINQEQQNAEQANVNKLEQMNATATRPLGGWGYGGYPYGFGAYGGALLSPQYHYHFHY
jgi:hypothetical protein